ncbi:MAG TPA: hypothetical protein DDX98_01125 [Bacteroidales bacterium]|jgi:hypothetical protein|nr:hypothetical protein [Bacteroidales bacterium]
MMKKRFQIIVLIVLSIVFAYFANLFFLAQYDYPTIRGNHVGLTILTVIVLWVFYFAFTKARYKK